jgi:hypothetical protein
MGLPIKVVGEVLLNKVMEFKFGLMVLNMKEIGLMDKLMEKVNLFILMVIYMMDIGKMEKLMVMVFLFIILVLNMKDIGKMIYNMDLVLKPGRIIVSTKENINLGRKMAKDNILGMMVVIIKEIG